MFIIGPKTLKIKEKDLKSITTRNAHIIEANEPNNGELSFSSIKLNIAIARCILSKNSNNKVLLFEAFSSFFRYQSIINTSNKTLTLNKEYIEQLRDFSKNTRIGELAQGITYLFAQEHLKYPFVVDFEGFIKNNNPNATIQGENPDFIIQNKNDNSYALIEAKGHYAKKKPYTKNILQKALNQCNNGEIIIKKELPSFSLNKSFGVCVILCDETQTQKSEIHYVDPTIEQTIYEKNINLIRYHYASWFLLMGNIEIYNKLINNNYLNQNDFKDTEVITVNKITYTMFNMSILDDKFNYFKDSEILFNCSKYGISKNILDLLMGNDDYAYFEFELNENINYEIFADGTIISKN